MSNPRFHIAVLLAGLSLAGFPHDAASQDIKKYAHEFYQDFRGKPLPAKQLHVAGKPDPDFLKEEPQGFRVTLPRTWIHPFGGVSVRTSFGMKGDFEITGAFEILQAEEPPKGFGVGASIRVQQVDPDGQGATLSRLVRAGGNQILFWDRVPPKPGTGAGGPHKCTEKVLRLRLKRTGGTLHYQWAPGLEGGEFEEIRTEKEFGDADITAMRMSAITGQQPCVVDVRFVDLRIRSGGAAKDDDPLPAPGNNLGPPPVPERSGRGWLVAVAIIGIVIALLAIILGIAALLVRRGRGKKVETDLIRFPCPECGKTITNPAASAGKKCACAKCGAVVRVPKDA